MSSVSVHRRVGAADGVHTHGGMPLAFGEEAPLQCAVPWVSLEGILLSDVAGHSVTKLPDAFYMSISHRWTLSLLLCFSHCK